MPKSGGQVGDTGTISTATGRAWSSTRRLRSRVCTAISPWSKTATSPPGQEAEAAVDAERRAAIRRNHTGTHLLHWALREVLGPHVKQQGSLVAPDRLRFDFTHYAAGDQGRARPGRRPRQHPDPGDDLRCLDRGAAPCRGRGQGGHRVLRDKYGERVRVVHAGDGSVELCGGTHVERLGMIGPVEVVSESSIGSNLRRVEALTGTATLERLRTNEVRLAHAASTAQVHSRRPRRGHRAALDRAAGGTGRVAFGALQAALAGEAVALAARRPMGPSWPAGTA